MTVTSIAYDGYFDSGIPCRAANRRSDTKAREVEAVMQPGNYGWKRCPRRLKKFAVQYPSVFPTQETLLQNRMKFKIKLQLLLGIMAGTKILQRHSSIFGFSNNNFVRTTFHTAR